MTTDTKQVHTHQEASAALAGLSNWQLHYVLGALTVAAPDAVIEAAEAARR